MPHDGSRPDSTRAAPLRVFFALWPDARTRTQLQACARILRECHGGRAVAPDNLHLTLAFLGEQPRQRLDELLQVAARLQGRSFVLCLNQAGYWEHPRVLWCAPDRTPPALVELNSGLTDALCARGFQLESRPYAPHVTLVRNVRAASGVRMPATLYWQPGDFSLVVSERCAEGVHYRRLAHWPLRAH